VKSSKQEVTTRGKKQATERRRQSMWWSIWWPMFWCRCQIYPRIDQYNEIWCIDPRHVVSHTA
jgi:hypothetical protein